MTVTGSGRRDGRLRGGAVGIRSSTAVAVGSTAPAYSLAVSVGLLVAAVGEAAPLALALSAVPVVLVALCFRELNRAEPDCGTTFAWTEKAFGVGVGRMVGWTTVMACVLVMSNLAQVAAYYSYDLLGLGEPSRLAQAIVGVLFIGVMSYLAYRGVQIAARTQMLLISVELLALLWFAVRAATEAGSLSLDLAGGDLSGWGTGFLVAVFLYWGWDSSFSLNEESADPRRTPAIATLLANGLLVVVYVVVTWTAVAYAGTERLAAIESDDFFAVLADDLLGTAGGKLLVGAVLVSALASTQTTILPTARTMLSMARHDAFPGRFARVSERYRTPSVATWVFSGVSAVLYVALVLTSESVLTDSVAAIAILVSLYYLATAVAVPFYFRRTAGTRERIVQRVVVPVLAVVSFTLALVLAVLDVNAVSLVVVAVLLVIGAAVMSSMKPHVAEETQEVGR